MSGTTSQVNKGLYDAAAAGDAAKVRLMAQKGGNADWANLEDGHDPTTRFAFLGSRTHRDLYFSRIIFFPFSGATRR